MALNGLNYWNRRFHRFALEGLLNNCFNTVDMKIVQISAVYGIGSVGKIVADIHRYLTASKNDSWVLYGVGPSSKSKDGLIRIASRLERNIAHAYYLLSGINFALCWFSTARVLRLVKSIGPDIVHVHCCNDFYVNIHRLLRVLNKWGVKIVITQHCEHYYTGSCGYSLACEKWKTTGCDSKCHFFQKHRRGYPFFDCTRLMWKRMFRTFRALNPDNVHFVSCTPWLEERMGESKILRRFTHRSVIYNGADTDIYHFREHLDDSKKIVLYVTPRFDDEIKGSKHINDIAKEFVDNKQVEFHLVGRVPPDFKFLGNIKVLGPLFGERLAFEYSKASVTLMLSKAECFPMVCVESVLCGTKVVAFECGGPDKAYDPFFATFVPWGDFRSMAEAVTHNLLPYNKKLVSSRAAKLYSANAMAESYLKTYYSFAGS